MKLSHRYIKPIVRTTAVAAVLGFIVLTAAPSWNDVRDLRAAVLYDDNAKISDSNANPENVFAYEGTDYLRKDAYPEINELMRNYYNACLSVDMDSLEGLVSDITQVDAGKLERQLSYMESVDNIICYTVDGEVEGTFRVYVYYDMKLKGIDTPAPALYAFYVTMSSDGNYIVYLSGLDGETQDFISSADASSDVQNLKTLVNARFQNVVDSDKELKEFCEMLDNGMLPSSAVSGSALDVEDESEAVSPDAIDVSPQSMDVAQ